MIHAKYSAALILAIASSWTSYSAFGQTVDPLFPSPNQTVAPSYTNAVPNGGAAISSVNATSGFGRLFVFGASSSDTRSSVPVLPGYGIVWSNGNANYTELLAPVIGATLRTGSTNLIASPPPTNFAIAGTNSATALPEVGQFQSAYGSFSGNDVAILYSGTNDFLAKNINSTDFQSIATTDVANLTTNVQQLTNLGAHNLVVFGLPSLDTFQAFTVNLGQGLSDPNALAQGAELVNQGLKENLVAIHNQTGANIHFFDLDLFVNEIRTNPLAYGFTVAGVMPGANCVSLEGFTQGSCAASATFAQQNEYIIWDGIHFTNRFHTELAQVLANQLLAPYTIEPQAQIAAAAANAFTSSLLLRLDSNWSQSSISPNGAVQRYSMFIDGGLDHSNRNSITNQPGYIENSADVTVGGDYKPNHSLMIGAAFNYASPRVNLASLGQPGATNIKVDAYQFASFASLDEKNWYANVVAGYGINQYDTSRSGIVDKLRSTHTGGTWFAAVKSAYLFDVHSFHLGPLVSMDYSNSAIDSYTETGDPLLNQSVSHQRLSNLEGGAGFQVRRPFTVGSYTFNPFMNLTAEHAFLNGSRSIVTAQTYALDLPNSTQVVDQGNRTFGKVAVGVSMDIGHGISAMINGSTNFARANINDYQLDGGLKVSF